MDKIKKQQHDNHKMQHLRMEMTSYVQGYGIVTNKSLKFILPR